MAIVKFISDKDCQVFIDMELAGKVAPESMLKVTLETGGYLIQVKDENGNLIKEYDLEIKPSDNQLLQKIDGANNKLDDIIENLKNDSSLVFHCDRASFCHNGLYGFVDKKLNIVIPPIYYSVNEFVGDKAFVVRDFPEGRKTTMIDSDGNIFFNRWFDYIGESDDTILLGIENRIIVYSKKKCDKVAEYYNAGYDFKKSLVPAYKIIKKSPMYGFIDFNGKEAIPFVFDNVSNFDEEGKAKVLFLGASTEIDERGFYTYIFEIDKEDYTGWKNDPEWIRDMLQDSEYIYYQHEYSPCTAKGYESWKFCPIWVDNKWIIKVTISISFYNDSQNINEKDNLIECDRVLDIGKGYCVYMIDNKINVLVADVQNSGLSDNWFDADNVRPVIKENFDKLGDGVGDGVISSCSFIVTKGAKTGLYSDGEGFIIPLEYDDIISFTPQLFAVKLGNRYGIYSNDEFYDFEYDNITPHYNRFGNLYELLLEKSNKYGLWKDSNIIPPVYDYIEDHGGCYLVSLDGKYGIIDSDKQQILPIKYDIILSLGDHFFKVKTNKGWSLGYFHHGIIYPNTFDDITFLSENEQWIEIFCVKKGEKYGCINNEGELILPINYDKFLLDSSFYTPRVFSMFIYKEGKVGFCVIAYFYSDNYCCKKTGTYHFEYIYYVEPQFDECVLQRNSNAVLGSYYMHYAAVRKDGKWGILDQKPRYLTYNANDLNLEDVNEPNWEDLNYKYNSLEDLNEDADKEFQRRFDKYYHPWTIGRGPNGEPCIVEVK